MSEAMSSSTAAEESATETAVESPPPAAMPARDASPDGDARTRLNQLAAELIKTQNRRLLVEFLRLRRSIRP